jgi:hypothetical protein
LGFDLEHTRRARERIEAKRERRHRAVLAMLEADSELRYAWRTEAEGDHVVLSIAIRDLGTAELTIATESHDAFKLTELIGRTLEAAIG